MYICHLNFDLKVNWYYRTSLQREKVAPCFRPTEKVFSYEFGMDKSFSVCLKHGATFSCYTKVLMFNFYCTSNFRYTCN